MILIDTNIFLELLMGQKRARECETLLNLVSDGKIEGVATHFTVHAIEAIIEDEEALLTFLRNLENSKGLYVYDTSISEESSIAIISKRIGRSFDDALQYYVAKKLGVEAIVSYDRHFEGLGVQRREPREAAETGGRAAKSFSP